MITPATLREARREAGLTQLETAVRIGVSYQCYRLWEQGGSKPNPVNVKRIQAVLKLETEEAHAYGKTGTD